MLDREQTQEIVRKLVSYTHNFAVINIYDNGEYSTRFANSEIIHNVETTDVLVVLTVYNGKSEATCSTNLYDDKSLKQLAEKADSIVRFILDGEYGKVSLQTEELPTDQSDHQLVKMFGVRERAEAIRNCVESLDSGFYAGGVFSLHKNMHAFGNSDGVFCYQYGDYVHFDTTVTNKYGMTGYGEMTAASAEDCNIENTFNEAYDKAKISVNPVFMDPGAYTVILEPAAVDGLMRFIATGLCGDSYLSGMSYASGRIGQKLFGENITLYDNVNNKKTIQCYFDAEGYRRLPVMLVDKGIVRAVVHDSKTSFKAGVKSTGHSLGKVRGSSHPANRVFYADGAYPINLTMNGGSSSLKEMISSTKKGILITHFHYMNYVDAAAAQVTGLTRDGTFFIENGKIKYAIHNMRFTESMLSAFNNVTALSCDRKSFGITFVPAVKIEGFHFTSGQR